MCSRSMLPAPSPNKCFTPRTRIQRSHFLNNVSCSNENNTKPTKGNTSDVGIGLKMVWFGAEALGNAIGLQKNSRPQSQATASLSRISRSDAIKELRRDYDVSYFISGAGDLAAYDPQCRFADPFASFKGVNRFKTNVSNLGGMLQDVQLDIKDWKEEENTLTTKWRFSAVLDLPWKPRLAAAGGTVHVFDPTTNLVIDHIESWDVDPGKVVKSLLKPSSSVPQGKWDVFMNALHDGDVKGVWLSLSNPLFQFTGCITVVSIISSAVLGEEIPGWWLFCGVCVASGVTEVVKLGRGMLGGEL